MSLAQTDYTDIGILIGFALQPGRRPGRTPEYRRVLGRYRTERDLKDAVDAILHGLGARPLSDGDFGLVLGVEQESPLAFRISDMPHVSDDQGKLLVGLVLAGLVAFAYPSAEEMEDDRVRHVVARDLDGWLHDLCDRLRSHDAAGEKIPEQGLDDAWRIYADMESVAHGNQGAGSGRLKKTCTRYWVHNVLGWLSAHHLARLDQSAAEPAWTLTERFRVQAKEMALERAYTFIAEIQRRPHAGTAAEGGSPT
ncbi:hypothetical protein ACQEU3_03525 [Spirillospora sp. CA-253888]